MEGIESEAHQEMDALMDQYLDKMAGTMAVGELVQVPVIAIRATHILVDVGEKAEGEIDIREVSDRAGTLYIKLGDVIPAVVKGKDPDSGNLTLSHREARRRVAFQVIEASMRDNTPIQARVSRVVKGGLIVDVGIAGFIPASQFDLRHVESFDPWLGQTIECAVLEFMPEKRRVILSRRKLLQALETIQKTEAIRQLAVGQVIEGTVKKLVDFGAFVDLGGTDGLIPRTEISWQRMVRPGDYLKVGEKVTVKVIALDAAAGKVTLSRRQLAADPWTLAKEKYPVGSVIEGEVVSITNYGAFVRIEEGLDGMIHIGDMGWDSGGKRPSDFVAMGQRVKAAILNVDTTERRIALGMKQLTADPLAEFARSHPAGTRLKGKVTGLAKYGAFVELAPGIEGLVHVSDFSWDRAVANPRDLVKKGDEIEVRILKTDLDQRRISLGVKQLTESPFQQFTAKHRPGSAVEGEIVSVTDYGVFLKLADNVEGFVHVSQLDTKRVENPAQIFKVGDKLSAEILKMDMGSGKIGLSRRQLLKREEKNLLKAYKEMKNAPGGTNLGELLSELSFGEDLPKE